MDVESLGAVRTMKPSWSAGLGSYRWIEVPSLQKHQDLQDDDGELFVGHYEDSTIGETDQSSIIQ
jgi:hypothetical protein